MVKAVGGHAPQIEAAAFVAENATLVGDITLKEGSSIWYGAVLRADTARITVEENANVQDNSVLHTEPGLDITIGQGASIGHSAVIHGCTIGAHCLIGMHATIMNGAVIGEGSLVAAGAMVLENTIVPPGSLVVGVPAKVRGPLRPALAQSLLDNEEEYLHLAALHRAAQQP